MRGRALAVAIVAASAWLAGRADGSPTCSVTPTESTTPTATPTASTSETCTGTSTDTDTETPTETATETETPTATESGTPTISPTSTASPSGSPTATPTSTRSGTVTVTHTPLAGQETPIAFPNPASPPYTTFYFYVASPGVAEIRVYNSAGELSARLSSPQNLTGYRSVRWDLSGVAPGMYAYEVRIVFPSGEPTKRYPFRRIAVLP